LEAKYSFLHIGKTGGTAVRAAIREHNHSSNGNRITVFGHHDTFQKIVDGDKTSQLFFFVREPVSRFISGFYSRMRRGRFGNKELAAEEIRAFEQFKTPNALAEALNADDGDIKASAEQAMENIQHVKKPLARYIGPLSLLESEQKRLFFIGDQKQLSSDFAILKKAIGLRDDINLPEEDVSIHKAPDGLDRTLSETAIANLRRHYQDDYPIYEWCLNFRERRLRELQS
jgi:hypothetical protein